VRVPEMTVPALSPVVTAKLKARFAPIAASPVVS
jgi:hypothetical protein